MTQRENISQKVLRNLSVTNDTRARFRVGILTTKGNGMLDPGSITFCRDIQHAVNALKILRKDRPDQPWVIRPKVGSASNWTNADVDALINHCLLIEAA